MDGNWEHKTTQADTWKAIAHIPWMVKPLYGFFTDTFPILGMRRRPYIAICGIAGTVAVMSSGHSFRLSNVSTAYLFYEPQA